MSSAFADDGTNLDAIFDRYGHAQHERPIQRAEMSCVSCHRVGATDATMNETELAQAYLVPANSVCHDCHAPGQGHLGAGPGMDAAPHRCVACHVAVPVPDTHDAGWLAMHGAEAQLNTASCRTCHERGTCVECHDRRENTAYDVHDASWLSVHGIAARAAPADCDACHAKSECTTCHDSAAGFGRPL